jgi:SAM-dependent methyltransferase
MNNFVKKNDIPVASSFLFPYTLLIDFDSILDIGSGISQEAAKFWLDNNKKVTSLDLVEVNPIHNKNHKIICENIMTMDQDKVIQEKFDAVYASHILEHIQDTGLFLKKIRNLMSEDGTLFIIVPPFKHNIVGGHVHVWNMGLLMYNLILSGFNVREGRFIKYGYNIAGIVKKESRKLPPLRYDNGDIEALKDFFPEGFKQNFYGDIDSWNWFES